VLPALLQGTNDGQVQNPERQPYPRAAMALIGFLLGFNPAQTTATSKVRLNPTSTRLLPLHGFFRTLIFQGLQAELHEFQNYS